MKKLILLTTFSLSTLCVAQPQPVPYVSAQEIPLTATKLKQFVDNHFLKYDNNIDPEENIVASFYSMKQKNCGETKNRLKNREECKQFESFGQIFNSVEQHIYANKIHAVYNNHNLSAHEKQLAIAHHVNVYIQIFNNIFADFNSTIKNEDDLQTALTFTQNVLTQYAPIIKQQRKKQLTVFGQPLFPRRK